MAGVAEERPKSPRARLFVALDLPDDLREGVAAWGGEELRDPALRPVAPESLHITLAFLGHRPVEGIERIAAVLDEKAGPAARVELRDPEQRPPRGRARVYALPALSPGAEALQAGISRGLREAGLYEPEKRPYWPHVTVARVRSEARGSRRPAVVAEPPGKLPERLSEARICRRITLYRSELKPSGAEYVPLAHVELPGQGGSEVD